MLRLGIFIIAIFTLLACKSNADIQVYSGEKLVTSINDKAIKTSVKQAFDNKQAVVFKKMPEFEYRVVFKDGENKEEWLLSSLGVIKLPQDGAPTYKLDLDMNILLPSAQ